MDLGILAFLVVIVWGLPCPTRGGGGGGALWPGTQCQGLSLRKSSHDARACEARAPGVAPGVAPGHRGDSHDMATMIAPY
jgi:hypothetical protein